MTIKNYYFLYFREGNTKKFSFAWLRGVFFIIL